MEVGQAFLRSSVQFITAVQFIRTFGEYLRFDPALYTFETETLEEALIIPEQTVFLRKLNIALLRAVSDNRNINEETWEMYLHRIFDTRYFDTTGVQDFPDRQEGCVSYWDLPLNNKVLTLNGMCDILLLDVDRFRGRILENAEGQEFWRVDPAGFDADGNTYWLFDDHRLYMESAVDSADPETETSGRWSLLCSTFDEWQAFPSRFAESKNKDERDFCKLLKNQLLPDILPIYEEKLRELESQFSRKRSGRIQSRELDMMEEQEHKKHQKIQESEWASMTEPRTSRRLGMRNKQKEQHDETVDDNGAKLGARELRRLKREEAIVLSTEPEFNTSDHEKNEGDGWQFKCMCGKSGLNYDDGRKMMACGKCGIWQHTACVNKWIGKEDWTKVDYFCDECRDTLESPVDSNSTDSPVDVEAHIYKVKMHGPSLVSSQESQRKEVDIVANGNHKHERTNADHGRDKVNVDADTVMEDTFTPHLNGNHHTATDPHRLNHVSDTSNLHAHVSDLGSQ